MWFMNVLINPWMCWVLGSPLHGWLSASLLLVSYRGRKTGKRYTLPVGYAQNGKQIYILPGNPEKKTWWRNLKGGLPLELTLRGQVLQAQGRLLDPQAEQAELAHGLGVYLQQTPGLAQQMQIRLGADGRPNPDDLRRAAGSAVLILVTLP